MSNNDLFCDRCKSHHHPVDCPIDDTIEALQAAKAKLWEALDELAWAIPPDLTPMTKEIVLQHREGGDRVVGETLTQRLVQAKRKAKKVLEETR